MGSTSDERRQSASLGEALVEFELSSAKRNQALLGCTGGVGCLGLLLIGSSVVAIAQGESWSVIGLNLGLLTAVVLIIYSFLAYGKTMRERAAAARFTVFRNGFTQSRPRFLGTKMESCLWSEINQVKRHSIIDEEVLYLSVIKNSGESIDISNQWHDFPMLVAIIDSRGAVIDSRISDEQVAQIMAETNFDGVYSPEGPAK